MAIEFFYKALDKNQKLVTGQKVSENEFDLSRELRSEKLSLIFAEPVSKINLKKFLDSLDSFGKISDHEKIIIYRNLSSMLDAGLPLSRSLAVLSRQSKNKKLKKILEQVNISVKKGATLSGAFKRFPKIFSPLIISMVMAGEESGNLSQSLRATAEQLEKSYLLKKKIKGSMVYPGIIIFTMIVIGFFMLVYVVPALTKTFSELSIDLPNSTKFIISLSAYLQTHYITIVLSTVFLMAFLFYFLRTSVGKTIFYWFLMRLPIIRDLICEINAAQTTRTLASLLDSGVSFSRSINITEEVIQNPFYKKVISEAGKNIQLGLPISKVFSDNEKLFPAFVGEMISVGEETGESTKMLLEVANFYESEVDQKTKNLSTIIEPVLMIFVGIVVGFFALSMIAPMYKLVEGL